MIDNLGFALDGAWRVLVFGLLFGAGLPLVFALGIRSLAWGNSGDALAPDAGAADSHDSPHPLGRVVAGLCLLVVLAGVALGLTIITATGFGKTVSFEHVYPTIVAKEG
ncbi:hypothetical protein [Nocardioides plantarum]|uniref:Uncharacterized protein n=1 Tax=Nocardioides plantarum TaxID=29299 RepID=A0ABV5K7M2_9ACTN|nr:hypothetical protein [Nocardioides plantarum]